VGVVKNYSHLSILDFDGGLPDLWDARMRKNGTDLTLSLMDELTDAGDDDAGDDEDAGEDEDEDASWIERMFKQTPWTHV